MVCSAGAGGLFVVERLETVEGLHRKHTLWGVGLVDWFPWGQVFCPFLLGLAYWSKELVAHPGCLEGGVEGLDEASAGGL